MFKVETEHKVAIESADHIEPVGAVNDNYTNIRLVEEIKNRFPSEPKVIDLGCAGGRFVADCIERGVAAVGLEGSDKARVGSGRHNWEKYGDTYLFNADISKPFQITRKGVPFKADVIHSEEVMEHISESDLNTVFQNIKNHLADDGLVFLGIAMFPDERIVDGKKYVYHVSVFDKEWWLDKLKQNGLVALESGKSDPNHEGFIFSSKVRDHHNSLYICAQHKTERSKDSE